MKHNSKLYAASVFLAAFVLISCEKSAQTPTQPQTRDAALSIASQEQVATTSLASVTIFATGLNNPRGLRFGPDGYLYVAEGGKGGTNLGDCTQVIPPIGPYTGSPTGSRISKISSTGVRTTVVDNLPSSQTSTLSGALISGVADVEFIDNTLYALIGGAGCSHGVPTVPNSVIKVKSDGSWSVVADLSNWSLNHSVANPEADDYEPDGTWYSMINVRGDLYAVEPNHGEMVKITTRGHISRVIDVSATQGHIVPTAVAYHGNFFIGNLNTFPVVQGTSAVYKVTPSGHIEKRDKGLTTILGIVFDKRDRMYVLEMTTAAGPPTPNTGKVVRIEPSGEQEEIATGLFFPTGMTMGPDGNLYVSNFGFGPPPVGLGQVLKIAVRE